MTADEIAFDKIKSLYIYIENMTSENVGEYKAQLAQKGAESLRCLNEVTPNIINTAEHVYAIDKVYDASNIAKLVYVSDDLKNPLKDGQIAICAGKK